MSDWDELERKYSGNAAPQKPAADPWSALESKYVAPQSAPVSDNGGERNLESLITGKLPALTRTDKVIKGAMDPINGGAQLLTNALPKSWVESGNQFNNWLADKTGLVGRLPDGGVDQQVREDEVKYQARRAQQGEAGFDGYRTVGNVVSPVNIALASKIPVAATLPGRIGLGGVTGALSSLLNPATSNDKSFLNEKLEQAGVGGAFGAAAPMATGALARLISPNAAANPSLKVLKDEGITPTIGQALGGYLGKIEEKAQSIPILGDMITRARGHAADQFETATHNKALAPIGKELPEGLSGRDAVNFTESAVKDAYDTTLAKIGAIKPDQVFNDKVASLKKMVNSLDLPKEQNAKFTSALGDVKRSIDKNGVMTSDALKTLESSLGTDARKLGASGDIYEGKLAPAVKQLQAELRDMLSRQAGGAADELKNANSAWAAFKRVQNAASRIGAEDGKFTPAQYASAVRALDPSKDKGSYARGAALGQELGDAGKSVLTNKVPDSGTAGRLALGGTALLSGALHPAIPGSLLAGSALYTDPAQRLLVALASTRPGFAKPTANALRQASPMLIPASAQMGAALLKK